MEERTRPEQEELRREEQRHDEPRHEEPVRDAGPREVPKDFSRDTPRDLPRDMPHDMPKEGNHDGSNDMTDYKHRFEHLQADFIEDPKGTVTKAEKLVEEAVERMVTAMHERVNRIHSELGDGTADTEKLRMAMRSYRELMDSWVRAA